MDVSPFILVGEKLKSYMFTTPVDIRLSFCFYAYVYKRLSTLKMYFCLYYRYICRLDIVNVGFLIHIIFKMLSLLMLPLIVFGYGKCFFVFGSELIMHLG